MDRRRDDTVADSDVYNPASSHTADGTSEAPRQTERLDSPHVRSNSSIGWEHAYTDSDSRDSAIPFPPHDSFDSGSILLHILSVTSCNTRHTARCGGNASSDLDRWSTLAALLKFFSTECPADLPTFSPLSDLR